MSKRLNVAIIGAGAGGLAAAYDLARAGHHVTVYEAEPAPGGLSAGFWVDGWDWSVEKFYHHWFQSDDAILNFIRELGESDKITFPRPITSVWSKGRAYPLDSAISALLFPHLSPWAKFRFGLVGIYLRLSRNWKPLERVTADEWLRRYMGREAYHSLWRPLLIGKFGELYKEVNMAWFWARIYKRSPRLGTFIGGFQAFMEMLARRVLSQGARIIYNTPVKSVRPAPEGGYLLEAGNGAEERYDAIFSTTPPDVMARLIPALPDNYRRKLLGLRYTGSISVILALKHRLLPRTYWLNLPATSADKRESQFPFLAVVEHTNFVKPEYFGGHHIVYLGDYEQPDHEYFSMPEDELADLFISALPTFNPNFSRDWIAKQWVFRARYAQPVPGLNHSEHIPPIRTPLHGVYMANMSQVYPWDRGTNYAVEMGRQVAHMIEEDFSRT